MIERRRFLDIVVKSVGYCALLFGGWYSAGKQRLGFASLRDSNQGLRLSFVLHYPENVGPEQAKKDAEIIFPARRADHVSSRFKSESMILKKECDYQTDRMIYSVTFPSRREYLEWENELKSQKAYDNRVMKQLGYRISTHKSFI